MPIRFEIYREGRKLNQFTPVAAVALGPESVPIPGAITYRDGLLSIEGIEDHPAGVGLLWDCGTPGAYHLETTRLPPRAQPYNLNVELARFRLMKIIQKQEDWNLFDFPKAEPFQQTFRKAQSLFADALGKLQEPETAARLADESLAASIELSEQLANFHAEVLLTRRRASGQFPRHSFGCRIDPGVQNQKYRDILAESFDFCVVPMSWKQLQPEEGLFITDTVDEWVELLSRKRIPVVAGPLINLSESEVPDWMFIWEHDFDTLRELAYEYVQKVVHRYRRVVSVWNIVAGLHTHSAFTLTFEQMIELTRQLVAQVKQMLPQSRVLVTVTQPHGEYHAKGAASVPPMLYAEMVAQSGVNFDAFAIEVESGVPLTGMYTRDVFQTACMLDRFSAIGRPLFITSCGVPGRASPDPSDLSEGKLDPAAAGRWRAPWDASGQAKWLEEFYQIALSRPFVECVAWSSLADLSPTLPSGGLLDELLRPKASFTKMAELRDTFHKPLRK
jgi:hypothetical protein